MWGWGQGGGARPSPWNRNWGMKEKRKRIWKWNKKKNKEKKVPLLKNKNKNKNLKKKDRVPTSTRTPGRSLFFHLVYRVFFFFYRVFDSFRPDRRSNRWPLVGWGFLPGFTEFRGLLPSFADFYRVSRQRNLSQKKKQKQNTVKPGRPPLNLMKRLPQCSRRLSNVSFRFFFWFRYWNSRIPHGTVSGYHPGPSSFFSGSHDNPAGQTPSKTLVKPSKTQ